jgi:hypothetical protein
MASQNNGARKNHGIGTDTAVRFDVLTKKCMS